MVAEQLNVGTVVVVVLVVVALWLAATVGLAPVLRSTALRELVAGWPTARPAANYPLLVGVVVAAHFSMVVVLGLAVQFATPGPRIDPGDFWFVLAGAPVVLVAVVYAGLAAVAPRAGWWRPADRSPDGRLALALGAAWYLVLSAIPLLFYTWILSLGE